MSVGRTRVRIATGGRAQQQLAASGYEDLKSSGLTTADQLGAAAKFPIPRAAMDCHSRSHRGTVKRNATGCHATGCGVSLVRDKKKTHNGAIRDRGPKSGEKLVFCGKETETRQTRVVRTVTVGTGIVVRTTPDVDLLGHRVPSSE